MSTAAPRDERGFVLSMVIFVLAALSIAGTAMFLVVQSEGAMATSGGDSSKAFQLANAGLARYMGESVGQPAATKTYDMGGGRVTVRAERILSSSSIEDLYLVTSDAEVADRRNPDWISRRQVRQFAKLRRKPFNVIAAMSVANPDLFLVNVDIDGLDQATPADCPTGGTDVAGISSLGAAEERNSDIVGDPPQLPMDYASMMNEIDIDWPMLTDPSMTFDYEIPAEPWPNLGRLPADEYPTIRVVGDFRAGPSNSGRGVLLVTGQLDFDNGFTWEGVILAGGLRAGTTNARIVVDGALLTGFAAEGAPADLMRFRINYNSCSVLRAAEGLATFTPVSNTWWESD